MGVTISNKLGQTKQNVKTTLDNAQTFAESLRGNVSDGVEIEIRRLSDYQLLIDVAGCETLGFHFKSVADINANSKDGFSYEHAVLTNGGKLTLDAGYLIAEYPQNEKWYSADFCKTQFAGSSIAHKIVADIIKIVASRCFYAEVNDEGDYYHTGILGDAVRAIRENGKLIDSLTGQLKAKGWQDDNITKGETKIGK